MPPNDFPRWLLSLAPIRLWAIIYIAFLALLLPGPIVWVLVYGDWPKDTAGQRIAILGYTIYALLMIAGIGQAALAMVKVHGKTIVGEFTVEGDDTPSQATTTVRTEVTTAPAVTP